MENGFDVSLLFFDLPKTFNSVLHLPLLRKLEHIGLNQHILQWIASYLCNRQYVVVDGATTSVLSGVLGPLLFLTSINYVSSLTHTGGSKLTTYADDILLYKLIDAIQDCISTNRQLTHTNAARISFAQDTPYLPPSGLLYWVAKH